MDKLARILSIVLLVVFAAGTVVHAERAASMSLAMSPVAMDDGDMGDCDGCPPDGGKAPVCSQTCLAPFVAIPAAAWIELPFVVAGVASSTSREPDGRNGPPDPSPPRTIVLN